MRRTLNVLLVTTFMVVAMFAQSHANGTLVGNFTVVDPSTGSPIAAAGCTVRVLDSHNAEELYDRLPITDANGMITLDGVPAGSYKVATYCRIDETCLYAYVGSDGLLSFDAGTTFNVTSGDVTTLTHEFTGSKCLPPVEIVPTDTDEYLKVSVYGTDPKIGLEGIQVILLNPVSGFEYMRKETDSSGMVQFGSFNGTFYDYLLQKVRFVDPSGTYQSEFYGPGETDSFSMGEVVDFSPDQNTFIEEGLVMQSTSVVINGTISDIVNLGLDPSVEEGLTRSLGRAVDFIEDENPNNDMAACGALRGFTGQLNGRVASGDVLESEAYELMQDIALAQEALGCR